MVVDSIIFKFIWKEPATASKWVGKLEIDDDLGFYEAQLTEATLRPHTVFTDDGDLPDDYECTKEWALSFMEKLRKRAVQALKEEDKK